MPDRWIDAARSGLMQGPTALVTILATEGMAPSGPGARMVVTPDGIAGTIGTGPLDDRVATQARALLTHQPGSWRIQDYLLGTSCRGRIRLLIETLDTDDWFDLVGRVPLTSHLALDRIERSRESPPVPVVQARGEWPRAFLEPVDAARRPLVLFGTAPVACAIARTAIGLPFQLAWFGIEEQPGVMPSEAQEMIACASGVPAEATVLILTDDAELDQRLAAAALQGAAGFVGLIGPSARARLMADGVDTTRLTCPIGLPDIAGTAPEVIAVSVLAQLLCLHGKAG